MAVRNGLLVAALAGGVVLGGAAAYALPGVATTTLVRPHVVLIILDTLRADRLGCYGVGVDSSPEIDDFAAHGVRFAHAYAQSSWTRPSIGSFLTSHYPRTLGIYDEKWDRLAPRFRTLAEVLHDHGYRTLGSTANPNINTMFGFAQGFDRYVDSNVVWGWMASKAHDAVTNGPRSTLPLAPGRFRSILDAIDEETPSQRRMPHYLQVDLMEVHEAFKGKPILRLPFRTMFAGRRDGPYLRSIRQVSADVQSFATELEKRLGGRDVLFVILADHGEGLFDHPDVPNSFYHGYLLYESSIHVPLIFYGTRPGRMAPGHVVDRPVRLMDVMPTVLDYVGIDPPRGVRGRSLLPLMSPPTEDPSLPDQFVVETQFRQANRIGLYAGPWKYFENRSGKPDTPARSLQPMGQKEDGWRTDVAARHPEVVRRLADELHRWEREHPASAPTEPDSEVPPSQIRQLKSLGYIR